MGILGRLSSLVKSNLNNAIDSMQDPAKEIDQMIRDMEDSAKQARTEVAQCMAEEKRLQKRVADLEGDAADWEKRAGTAVRAGDDALAKEAIEAELIDLRTLRPLDTDTVVESVKKTNRLVTVEQGWPICSIGSEIAAAVVDQAFDYLDAPPARIAGKDVPMPYAANLERLALPTVEDIVAAAKSVLYRN